MSELHKRYCRVSKKEASENIVKRKCCAKLMRLKGTANLVNSKITVSQIGGIYDDIQVIGNDTTYLKKGSEVTLYLTRTNDGKYIPIAEDNEILISDNGKWKSLNGNLSDTN
jgi:uncharacterized protein YcfJ